MKRESIVNKLAEIFDISEAENVDEVNITTLPGFDSFRLMNYIVTIEDEFGVTLTSADTESQQFRTVGGIANILHKKIS